MKDNTPNGETKTKKQEKPSEQPPNVRLLRPKANLPNAVDVHLENAMQVVIVRADSMQ
jgi:hypothetical protein